MEESKGDASNTMIALIKAKKYPEIQATIANSFTSNHALASVPFLSGIRSQG